MGQLRSTLRASTDEDDSASAWCRGSIVAAVAASAGASSAEELCSHLLTAFLPTGAAREDDVAILVARLVDPAGAPPV